LEERLASERRRADEAEENLALARKALAAAMLGWSDANTRPVIEVSLIIIESVFDRACRAVVCAGDDRAVVRLPGTGQHKGTD
jgi:hypothetical protein